MPDILTSASQAASNDVKAVESAVTNDVTAIESDVKSAETSIVNEAKAVEADAIQDFAKAEGFLSTKVANAPRWIVLLVGAAAGALLTLAI